MRPSKEELQIVRSLGDGVNDPLTFHAIQRLKERRTDVPFIDAVVDVVDAWREGFDLLSSDYDYILSSCVKNWDKYKYRYVLHKGFVYVFKKNRVLITIHRPLI